MRRLAALFCLSLFASCAAFVHTSPPASADAVCTVQGAPTPAPIGIYKITVPLCNTSGQLMISGGGGAGPTPIPYPTGAGGVILVQPTSVPTTPITLPASFQTAFPTPIAMPTDGAGIPYSHPTSMPSSYNVFRNSGGPLLGVTCDQTVPVNSTTTGTVVVSLIPITFGLTTYVCNYFLNASVSAGATVTLEYGVHISGSCDTGPSALSGPIALLTGQSYQMGAGLGGVFAPGSTREFCMVVTGTGTSIQGYVTFTKF